MRTPIISAGKYIIEDEPAKSRGFIGGNIYVRNTETGEEYHQMYKNFHGGKTNKWQVAATLLERLAPVEEEENEIETESESPSDDGVLLS